MQTTQLGELVIDEVEFLRTVVALTDADIAELGCGKAEMARKLIERKLVRSVKALEVDSIQHAQNCASAPLPGLEFLYGSADDIPLQDASCDLVIMLKSLHHVPIDRMDRSLREIHRVLKPGEICMCQSPSLLVTSTRSSAYSTMKAWCAQPRTTR